jgi:DNA-binding transcriptional LysR family regulator
MFKFTLRQLEIFLTAAEYSSFALAAKFLYMSKPAITKQIQVLESQLDTKLFKQVGRNMRITTEGRRILPQVRKILDEANQLKKFVALGLDREKPMLRFSIGHTFARLIFTSLYYFSRDYVCQYDVAVDPQDIQFKKLELDKVDFLITGLKVDDPKIMSIPFSKVAFFLVAAKSNPLTQIKSLTINDVKNSQFIQIKASQMLDKQLQTKFDLVNKTFSQIMQLETYYSIKDAIKADLGIGVLPETLLSEEMDNLSILPVRQFEFSRTLSLLTNKENKEIKTQFIDFVKSDFKLCKVNIAQCQGTGKFNACR